MAISAVCYFKRTNNFRGEPPYRAVGFMLADLEQRLRDRGVRPVGLRCLMWHVPDRPDGMNTLAHLAIEHEPGDLTMSLHRWFQWQHPAWQWSHDPLPAVEHSVAMVLAP